MTYRTTFLASLSVVALVLSAGETFADPGPVRGAGAAPSRPAFPSADRVCINIITGDLTGFLTGDLAASAASSMVCADDGPTYRWEALPPPPKAIGRPPFHLRV